MASFIIGTTPKFTVSLEGGESYSDMGKVFFRLTQGDITLDVTPELSEDGLKASFSLTQAQTLGFSSGNIRCQLMGVNGPEESEAVRKSEIFSVLARPTLIPEEVHNPAAEPDDGDEGGDGGGQQAEPNGDGNDDDSNQQTEPSAGDGGL